jgi:hypothetical protein
MKLFLCKYKCEHCGKVYVETEPIEPKSRYCLDCLKGKPGRSGVLKRNPCVESMELNEATFYIQGERDELEMELEAAREKIMELEMQVWELKASVF